MADPIIWLSGKEGSSTAGSSSSSFIDARLENHPKPCPRCGYRLESKEGIQDWPGLPSGVKFDPTDQELLEHLEAKAEIGGSKPHPLIDEFIPTLEGEDGICYTHPEKLPGVTRDGLNRHFFHRPSKAYTTGTRKRRKIQGECDLQGGETRWHKTGKTRPVMINGKQKGCKKILVLYTNFGKHRKPEKTNWVMHQYHLGLQEEEKEGELVVSKVFYQTQPRQCNWERNAVNDIVLEANRSQESMTDIFTPEDMGGLKTLQSANNPPGIVAPSLVYNVDDVRLKKDQFSHARTPFDEGISDSGKGSDTSHCTPQSEHEEHEQKKSLNDDDGGRVQGLGCVFRHNSSSLMRFNNNNKEACDTNVEHNGAHESQDPDIHEADLAAMDEKTMTHERIQPTRQHNSASRSSLHKLSLEDILIDSSGIKEAPGFTNSQETDWLKYSSFWSESDSPENQRMI